MALVIRPQRMEFFFVFYNKGELNKYLILWSSNSYIRLTDIVWLQDGHVDHTINYYYNLANFIIPTSWRSYFLFYP